MSDVCETIRQMFTDYVRSEGNRQIDTSQLTRFLQAVSQHQLLDILSKCDELSPNEAAAVLHCAATKGDAYLIKCIIEQIQSAEECLDLLTKSEWNGHTVVQYAAKHVDIETMEYIIQNIPVERRADVFAHLTNEPLTALHLAASNDHEDVATCMLSCIPVEKASELLMSTTVVHYAAMNDHVGIFEYILNQLPEKASDMLKQESDYGKTVMHYAARNNKARVIEFLLRNMPTEDAAELLKKQDRDGFSAVMYAAKYGYMDSVRCLLGHSSPIQRLTLLQLTSSDGKTAEQLTSWFGKTDIVSFLQQLTKSPVTTARKFSDDPAPQEVSPNYIEKVEEQVSCSEKESKEATEPPVPPKPYNQKTLPQNYIAKVEQLEALKEIVTEKIVEFEEKGAKGTEQIAGLQKRLAAIEEEHKKESRRKDELIYSLGIAQANLASTTKVLVDTNIRLQEHASEKRRMEYDRANAERELAEARSKLQQCEDRLQEMQSKEQDAEQEREKLVQEQQTYRIIIERLEKRKVEIEEQLQRVEKEFREKTRLPDRSQPEPSPPITTVAQQPEATGEQEVNQYSGVEDLERFTIELQRICTVEDTETEGDKKEDNALPVDNVYTQEKEKERAINTTFLHRELDVQVETTEQLSGCNDIDSDQIEQGREEFEVDEPGAVQPRSWRRYICGGCRDMCYRMLPATNRYNEL